MLNIVKGSITAQRLIEELEKGLALWGGPRKVLRMDNGPDFISSVLQQSRRDRIGISWIPPDTPRNIGHTGSFNNRLRKECLNRNQSGHSKRQRGSKTSRTATTTDICTDPRAIGRTPSTLHSALARTRPWLRVRPTPITPWP